MPSRSPARPWRSAGTPRSSTAHRRRPASRRRPTARAERASRSRSLAACRARCSCSSRSVTAVMDARAASRSRVVRRPRSSCIRQNGASCRPAPSRRGCASWASQANRSRAAGVIVSLLEGGVPRHSETLHTDRGGLVMARVPIPRIDEPVWEWTLRAQAEEPGVPATELTLTPREELPGTPVLGVEWQEPASGVLPGDRVHFAIRLRDATGQPVIEHAVRYWIGPKGTAPPKTDTDWDRVGTRASTDGGGEVKGTRNAPTLVKSTGTSMVLVARAIVEGHALEQTTAVVVGAPNASAELTAEAPAIVPGLTQRMMLTVTDGHGEGIAGAFSVTADGLAASVTTDARGEAELTWTAPLGVGATRNVGPCAGGVAAAVVIRPTRPLEVLRSQQEPFTLCLPIDRDAAGIVHVTPDVARPGRRSASRSCPPTASRPPRTAWSSARVTSIRRRRRGSMRGPTAPPPGRSRCLRMRQAERGTSRSRCPDGSREARVLGARVLVVPSALPLMTATRIGGRATPGGVVDFEARLTDGHGHGLPGVGIVDRRRRVRGRQRERRPRSTRDRACAATSESTATVAPRCSSARPRTDAIRRALLGRGERRQQMRPANDPGARVSKELEKAFSEVLHSLEGAVFEADEEPADADRRATQGERSLDHESGAAHAGHRRDRAEPPDHARRREARRSRDLVAVDPQVTFDNVARRVTRLKLFTVLAAVRAVRSAAVTRPRRARLQGSERAPAPPRPRRARSPRTSSSIRGAARSSTCAATARRLRRSSGPSTASSCTRPAPTASSAPPTTCAIPSSASCAPARRMRARCRRTSIVDAKWDMVVSETTVAAWQKLFEELTGRELGFGAGGLGLSGVGEGGGGSGIGLGSIGTVGHGAGTGRGSAGISNGDAYWSPPVRTDAEGRVRISVPLGGGETTWRVAFVGVPDGLGPASTTADVASDLAALAAHRRRRTLGRGRRRRDQRARAQPHRRRVSRDDRSVGRRRRRPRAEAREQSKAGARAVRRRPRARRSHRSREASRRRCRRRSRRPRRARSRIARRRAPSFLGDRAARRVPLAHADGVGGRQSGARHRARSRLSPRG